MRVDDVFLSFRGRLDRRTWFTAVAVLVSLNVAVLAMSGFGAEAGWITQETRDSVRIFVRTGLLAPWLALDWKRFHDLDLNGLYATICPGLYIASLAWDWPIFQGAAGHETVRLALSTAQVATALWVACVLVFLPGTDGDNRHGPDPRHPIPRERESPSP